MRIPRQRTDDLLGHDWYVYESFPGTFFWLNHDHYGVYAEGTIEACGEYPWTIFSNAKVNWEWKDEIDAKTYGEALGEQANLKSQGYAKWLPVLVEGTYDLASDKVLDLEFDLNVHWKDARTDVRQ